MDFDHGRHGVVSGAYMCMWEFPAGAGRLSYRSIPTPQMYTYELYCLNCVKGVIRELYTGYYPP